MKPWMKQPKPLADFMGSCLGPALAAQGFAATDIIAAWPDIVGERLARFSQPIRIDWPRRSRLDPSVRPDPAILKIRVEGAFALELQHLAPIVIERLNTYYGWRCVGRIVLVQGPVRRTAPRLRVAPALAEADRDRIAAAVTEVGADGLRAALERLGTAVIGARRRPG
jgi:hypothetical protein